MRIDPDSDFDGADVEFRRATAANIMPVISEPPIT
jgi:hypothetical protein